MEPNQQSTEKSCTFSCCACVRPPDLTAEDRQVLDRLDAWSAGGEDNRFQSTHKIISSAVRKAVEFSLNCYVNSGLSGLIVSIGSNKRGAERDDAMDAHNQMMADLIRREMPLPPVVE